jgi:hypothetical protein
MNRTYANYGLTAVVIASLVVVPLNLACAILSSETPMSHDSFVRMIDAAHGMLRLYLALQIVAGWLLVTRFKTHKTPPVRLLLFVGLTFL